MCIVFSLLSSISAVELSDNDIIQNNDDNIINTIELDEENENMEIISMNSENALEESSENQLKDANTNTIYISASGDDLTGDGSKDNPYKTVKQGIENSNNQSIIYLSEGNFDAQNISIDKTLTIEGVKNKTVIDANHISRIFFMTSDAKLTLIGLTLINGNMSNNETGLGGSIYNDGGELTLINCTIKDSYSGLNGGAIYNNMGKLSLIESDIINNTAVQYGGAIYSAGITNIENSYFTENHITAEKGVGGAIACGGIASISNTLFLKNYAIYSAGAILNLANATLNNCSFINQTTEYTGGAISNHNYMVINNSIFSGGYSRFYAAAILAPPSGQHVVTEVYNTIFEKNYVGAHGAVSNNFKDTELKMENCAIVGNYILLEQGGKIYGDIALDDNASTLYCWWGQNEISPYYYSPHSETYESWKINASKWLVMEFTSSNEIIKQDVNNVLNVNIKHYFDNETKEIYDYDEDINLPLTVKFYTNTGQTIAEVELVNGSASINYIPANNVKTVYAKLSNQTIEISVKQKNESKLIASDLSKYYKENKDLEIKLTDNNNNPLYNKTVKILLNGKEYNLATNNNGIVKVPLDLNIGTYTAKISFDDEEYRNQNKNVKITVLKNKTSIKASNLVKYYKNSTKLSVKLLDNNKKPLKSKTVKIRIAGKTYSKTTNSKGIATFAINQKVGTYSVKISFNGDKTYQSSSKTIKVYVKSAKLTTKTKKIHRKSYFVATLKDKNGKAIKKTKVKFKLNGKTYTRTTNNKGIAKLKITVKIGTYKIKTSFKSTKIYGATVFTNKIKVIR